MADDLVKRLRTDGPSAYEMGKAADRIEKLEAALETIIWNCPHEGPGDWCGDDYCPCQTARKALGA
jgi:hypothetical protein